MCHTSFACDSLDSFLQAVKYILRLNTIAYDITVHLGRTISILNSQPVNIDEYTKDSAD